LHWRDVSALSSDLLDLRKVVLPLSKPGKSANPLGAKTKMVEPCWNQPISWPLTKP
jgi:hypothetical protein